MMPSLRISRTGWRKAVLAAAAGILLAGAAVSLAKDHAGAQQSSNPSDPERQRALELYSAGKMVDAMPVLEQLAATYPKDLAVWEAWGVATVNYAQTLNDPELRKKARVRGRSILLKARDLGDNSNLLQTFLNMLPEDGSESSFSPRQEVDELMQQAEADFARGNLDKAREGYIRALLLDPNLYSAALFTGDVYFKQHQLGSAGEWFSRAVQIDPNRETAYRYWGDALMQAGKMEEARGKFIEAIIAEPYSRNPWMGLGQWADHNHVKLNFVRLQDMSKAEVKDGQTNITLDSSVADKKNDPVTAAWLAYAMNRALWQREKFKKEFPNEAKYRHTFREEADSLHAMAAVISELAEAAARKDQQFAVDSDLAELVKIDQAGMLEPFALLNRADKEIAVDYDVYRNANRDKLRRYLEEVVVPKMPAATPESAASQ